MSGNHSNNISWGLPVSNNGANVNIMETFNTPLSGQNNNTITNNNFYDITTPSINTDPELLHSNLNLFDKGNSPVTEAKIQMNGQDRITYKDFNYFNIIQPFQHHTNIPAIGINLYSFSLYPEDFQPSGSCNYSVIDSSYLLFKITNEAIATKENVILEFMLQITIFKYFFWYGNYHITSKYFNIFFFIIYRIKYNRLKNMI